MEFFSQIAALNLVGDLTIVARCTAPASSPVRGIYPLVGGEDNGDPVMTVSVSLNNVICGDPAARLIMPLLLTGTASELDAGFVEALSKPLQTTSALLLNMEAHLNSVETARLESAQIKDQENAEKKERERQKKSYDEAMTKVAELETGGRHREAFAKLPDVETHPLYADAIAKRKSDLTAKFSQGSLFGA